MSLIINSKNQSIDNQDSDSIYLFGIPASVKWIWVLGFFLIFWFSIELATESCVRLGTDFQFFISHITSSAIAGFSISIILTAIVQSSSVITALSVALVASNMLSLQAAVPIIIGANIGTTITATAVSLTYLTRRKYFRKAYTTALLHTIFNLWGALVWFLLELYFGLLSNISAWFAHLIKSENPIQSASHHTIPFRFLPDRCFDFLPAGFWLCLAIFCLLGSVYGFARLLGRLYFADIQNKFSGQIFTSKIASFLWGLGLTAFLRSSTVVSSSLVALSASDKIPARRIFTFIMGVNVGTTITALLAVILRSEAAIGLAIAHFLFNTTTSLFFVPDFSIRIVLGLARKLARWSCHNTSIAFVWLFLLYFFVPLLTFLWSQASF